MEKGLIKKYIISKADGTPVDPKAKYFVLRYDRHMQDRVFLRASRKALSKFISEIVFLLPELSKELWDDVANEILDEQFPKPKG